MRNYKFSVMLGTSGPIQSAKLYLREEKDFSEGKFATVLKPGSLQQNTPFMSNAINAPTFQLSVNFNPQSSPPECLVLIGTTSGDPESRRSFAISDGTLQDAATAHEFVVSWENNWKITGLDINGKEAKEKE